MSTNALLLLRRVCGVSAARREWRLTGQRIAALATVAVRIHTELWIARRCLLVGIGGREAAVFTQAMVLVLGGLSAWSFAS
jgi:hypothetical protein